MTDRDCRRACEAWMAALDEGAPVPETVETHVRYCPDCRAFTAAALRAGEELRAVALPTADADADRSLLARLRESRRVSAWEIAVRRLESWRDAPRPTLRLAGAGLASFAVTLLA